MSGDWIERWAKELQNERVHSYWPFPLKCIKDWNYLSLTSVMLNALVIANGCLNTELHVEKYNKNVLNLGAWENSQCQSDRHRRNKDVLWEIELYPVCSEIISYAKPVWLAYNKYLEILAAKKGKKTEKRRENMTIRNRAPCCTGI